MREFTSGLLRDFHSNFLTNLGRNEPAECSDFNKQYYPHLEATCFKSGDTYVNNNPFKSALVNTLFRQHNRIAKGLEKVNFSWEDERLFQESRKILGAMMEIVTYKETTS
jgi:hypothetical protein